MSPGSSDGLRKANSLEPAPAVDPAGPMVGFRPVASLMLESLLLVFSGPSKLVFDSATRTIRPQSEQETSTTPAAGSVSISCPQPGHLRASIRSLLGCQEAVPSLQHAYLNNPLNFTTRVVQTPLNFSPSASPRQADCGVSPSSGLKSFMDEFGERHSVWQRGDSAKPQAAKRGYLVNNSGKSS